MSDIKLIQDLRLVFFFIWLILMLYGFYKYYKNIDCKNISLGSFTFVSLVFFWCGYITTAMFFGLEHLYLLPFMPLGIFTIIHWYQLNTIVFCTGIIVSISCFPVLYYLVIKRIKYNLNFKKAVAIALWSCFFISGYMSFLYVLSWNIF